VGFLEVVQRGLGKTSIYKLDLRVGRREGSRSDDCPAGPDRQLLPVKSGNRCRSDRQMLPFSLYKNMHLIIYKEVNEEKECTFEKTKKGTET